MNVLRTGDELSNFLRLKSSKAGCLADTNFLFGLAYKDDRLFERANDIHDLLAEYNIPIYANVTSRIELIDLIFRKQVTDGCVQLFNSASPYSHEKTIYKTLKHIRDKVTAGNKKGEIFKVNEWQLKQLRKLIASDYGIKDWKHFCSRYVGEMLFNEWVTVEEELGLNFVEIMQDDISDLFDTHVTWPDLVRIMGEQGLRGPDAMIVNLFSNSKFPLLISGDSDFETFSADILLNSNKVVFIL